MKNKKFEPKVGVKIVLRAGGKVMFHKTKDGIRDLPGGHIEFGETIIGALKRELLEEMGFDLKVKPKLFYAWTYISRDKSRQEVYVVYLADIGKKPRNFFHKERNDIEFVWLKKGEIKKQKFLPEMENLLLKAFEV